MMSYTPEELLGWYKPARERLASGHLAKFLLQDGNGGYCARGALIGGERWSVNAQYTRDYLMIDAPLAEAMFAIDAERAPGDGSIVWDIADWNNHPVTMKEDVLAAFDRAIEALEAQLAHTEDKELVLA